ncbi:glycosyltransferase family 2 protein [Priestia aryabhattai]|uniref:glycosyltransferase family 2 protein n=1 Tax=Priestia aryabhattai TaxID=412384 RepID=UPI001FB56B85|nr:glycosyltransferase [Priestia aryabhattai]MED4000956.1 glycosyltransferase [Priestia aryabhattai]
MGICIPTFKRYEQLEKCINECINSICNVKTKDVKIDICVIDNECSNKVLEIVNFYKGIYHNVWYFKEELKGYSFIRNACLKTAEKFSWDYLAFIDDDEFPSENWINALIQKALETNADIVLGRVEPVYDEGAPRWMVKTKYHRKYLSEKMVANISIGYCRSDNVLIKLSSFKNTKFDLNFNVLGSEDFKFFYDSHMTSRKNIQWEPKAVTYERIPIERTTLLYNMLRAFNIGRAHALFDKAKYQRNGTQIFIIFKGIINIVLGLLKYVHAIFLNKEKRYKELCLISRGFGRIIGSFYKYNSISTK